MNPGKMTAQEKEAQIMAEIRLNTVKFTPNSTTPITMNPGKMTAQEKEAQIMAEIRLNTVKFTPKYETTFLGNFFGFAFKSN
ncbi:hypothetical protein METBIDRAFT_97230 [Metschnikowia bicuspidata var. bicuspidata NRRL YB-4993]|uniref:Uncharacterized protein n=1 Tax=Metschnikowia bicuspidata var. bicuspidata NRRL YB-4993 TaxID=869754 RepID=A0A1A0HGD7_9ASCO|nr:hypothetical protein METBIDRAFT_97230 [Metschnikowia bicuspidata var. bicuspidata NRRL YB-4993]OBA23055.1 hypothetical protein METBIDRAFT_97230 [Metschnikowia bicuspidata var. bicuspidata NRRL YB-4993]